MAKQNNVIYHGSSVTNLLFLLFFRIMGFIKAIYPQVTWKIVCMNDEEQAWISKKHETLKMSCRAPFQVKLSFKTLKRCPFKRAQTIPVM